MSAKNNHKKTFNQSKNKQQQLVNANHSDTINDSGINQSHNAKKEGLGPNTNR